MGLQRTYTLKDETVLAQRAYAKRKSQAKQFLWKQLKLQHPEIFESLVGEFNARYDSKITERGDI